MTSLRNIVRFRIHEFSTAIHELKKTSNNFLPVLEKYAEWVKYEGLKEKASHWLTAMNILRRCGKVHTKDYFRKVIRANPKLFTEHLPGWAEKAERNKRIFLAWNELRLLQNQLDANPDAFPEAEAYAAARQKEAEQRFYAQKEAENAK